MSEAIEFPATEGCPECGGAEIIAFADGSMECMWCRASIPDDGWRCPPEYRDECRAKIREHRREAREARENGDRWMGWFKDVLANHLARGLLPPLGATEDTLTLLGDMGPVDLRSDSVPPVKRRVPVEES